MKSPSPRNVSRRDAVRWMLGAAATISVLEFEASGIAGLPTGIGTDPNLHKKIIPWERLLTAEEMQTVTALCDVILPADDRSPSASAVGVPDFINEWVSAPYPQQVSDRDQIRAGLAWINSESQSLFSKAFAELDQAAKIQICDTLCPPANAKDKTAAAFFTRMRHLTAGGFYTTPEGWKDIGYLGNSPMVEFPGPPPEVRDFLKL